MPKRLAYTERAASRENEAEVLSTEMLERLKSYGQVECFSSSEVLLDRGTRRADLFVVIEGQLELFERRNNGRSLTVSTLNAAQFTGELDLLGGREVLLSCRTTRASKVLRIRREHLQRMMRSELDVADLIVKAWMRRRAELVHEAQGGVLLLGYVRAVDTLRLQQFLTRNGYPFKFVDAEANEGAQMLLTSLNLASEEIPVVFLPEKKMLHNPSNNQLADELGISETLEADGLFDVAIIGAGPAGLAAAVYAASEGLRTVLVEGNAPGGQAGTSSRIENYLGFPTGVSGQELAVRAEVQARKFGANIAVSKPVRSLESCRTGYRLCLDPVGIVYARAVILATGAKYRKLAFSSSGDCNHERVHYAATAIEAAQCAGKAVIVVGGGNSAGQAAIYLAQNASHVHLVVRGDAIAKTMSDYLIQRILLSTRISVYANTEVEFISDDKTNPEVGLINRKSGSREVYAVGGVFAMIGATPNTAWLSDGIKLDDEGFVLTGGTVSACNLHFETSSPGVFAIGDVRSGSTKRVASAVGEGSVVISEIHKFLAEQVCQ